MKGKVKFILIGIVVLVAATYFYFSSSKKKTLFITESVQRGTLTQSVEATGSVESSDELELSFKNEGKIREVTVAVGDAVEAGMVLASLTDTTVRSQADRARAALQSAEADLEKLIAGTKPEDIAVAKEQVEKARVDFESAKTARLNLETKQAQTKLSYYNTALQALQDAAFVDLYTMNIVYDGILDPSATDSFKTANSVAYQDARIEYDAARLSYSAAVTAETEASVSKDDQLVLRALQLMRTALEDTSDMLDSSVTALAGATENASFSQTTIDALESSFNTQASSVATKETGIQSSAEDYTIGLETMKAEYDAAIFSEKTAQQALNLAQSQLDAKLAQPQSYEIKQQQSRVLQAQADVLAAEGALDDTLLRAPVSGVITAVDIKVGEVAAPNKPAMRMIGQSKLQIDVDIPESDINKMRVGQEATITLDAFGSDVSLSGHIAFIEPSERIIQDVVYYRVTVYFDIERTDIKPGMTATITVITAKKENVLHIPLRAVTVGAGGERTARILTSAGTPAEKIIVTGIRADDGSIEVVSGLSEGEVVITGENK